MKAALFRNNILKNQLISSHGSIFTAQNVNAVGNLASRISLACIKEEKGVARIWNPDQLHKSDVFSVKETF